MYVDSQFFTRWSADMAYLLGVICADGCLVEHANGHHCLNITSKDLTWLQQIKHTLQAQHKIGWKRRAYQLQIRNQVIYHSLLDLGLTPRKSKTLRLPPVPPDAFPDFVRGYFDGDGCVVVWQEKRWRRVWQLKTAFASGSRYFLEQLRGRLCDQARLTPGSLRFGARVYCLEYAMADSLRLYDFMHAQDSARLCLTRKRERFERFLALRRRAATMKSPSALDTSSEAVSELSRHSRLPVSL